jgi:immune inhibitor InhA-like protein
MTIDSFDWLHRTGPNPPNDPSTDLCANATARPFLYEGVFAHEYQHLLENYVDFDEVSWVNEGISDYAQTITNYVDATIPVTQIGFDNHIQCFLGYNDVQTPANPIPRPGGPENSLTRWGDQTDYEQEVLCDYGAAYSFMLYLQGQFGDDFLSALHLDPANGLDSLAGLLKNESPDLNPGTVITRWAAMIAVDKSLDAGWTMVGSDPSLYSTPALNADINWDNDQAYAADGAPANGSDYVRLRDADGNYLNVSDVTQIDFDGSTSLPPLPLDWTVAKNPPKGSDGKALYSGMGDNLDRSLAQKVKVGHDGKVQFDTWYAAEDGYDYAYVQVSDNNGKSYKSVKCTDSIDGPLGPAFNSKSGGWLHESCNLKKYAGKKVILSFRYVTDGGVAFKGFYVDNVEVGGDVLSTGKNLKGWSSPTQIAPTQVQEFVVQLVSFDETGHVVHLAEIPLDSSFDGSLSGTELSNAIGTQGSTVAAIVTYLDRSEQVQQQALYTLSVNGVVQPGGGQAG